MAANVDTPVHIEAVRFNWRTLLYTSAFGNLIVLVTMGIFQRDRLPLGLAVVVALGLWLLNVRGGLLGDILLGLLFADIAAWTLSAALANIVQGEEFMRLVFPAALAALSSAGCIAAAAALVRRRFTSGAGEAPRAVGLLALGFFLIAVIAGAIVGPGGGTQTAQASTVAMNTENMTFSMTEVIASPGEVTVEIDNHDLWWHTFTIDALAVNLRLPSSGKRQVTFMAEPGVYEFYCAIPGHDALGMRGTLTVR